MLIGTRQRSHDHAAEEHAFGTWSGAEGSRVAAAASAEGMFNYGLNSKGDGEGGRNHQACHYQDCLA